MKRLLTREQFTQYQKRIEEVNSPSLKGAYHVMVDGMSVATAARHFGVSELMINTRISIAQTYLRTLDEIKSKNNN